MAKNNGIEMGLYGRGTNAIPARIRKLKKA